MKKYFETKFNLIIKLTALISVLLILLSSCSSKIECYESQFFMYFDTMSSIVAYCDDENTFNQLSQAVESELKIYHELFDIYNSYDGVNNLKTVNANSNGSPIAVDEKIIDLLLFSKEQFYLTSGKVNAAMGSVTAIWHDYREQALISFEDTSVPSEDELNLAASYTDFSQIEIDAKNSTVTLPQGTQLDVGALAKGYVIDQLAQLFDEYGVDSGFINIGGNVKVLGEKPDGSLWNVGIRHYDISSAEGLLYLLEIENLSLATSGNYERFYTADSQIYHHIIDPVTLFPSEYFLSVSVLCESAADADALSTALFNMPLDEGISYIEDLENTYAVWVSLDETVTISEGMEEMITEEY